MSRVAHRTPTLSQLKLAHSTFADKEARDLFYQVATELVDRAFNRTTKFSVGQAIAVLLGTWNRRFYQRGRRCDRRHVEKIDGSIEARQSEFQKYRARSIESLRDDEQSTIQRHFAHFEPFLGRVGVAKAFHLIGPNFFPLWDNEIASEYGVPLKSPNGNAVQYWKFMVIMKADIQSLGGAAAIEKAIGTPALKALDEYAYCRFTTGWI